eukprot:2983998-Alexandrium_andersonii.AAC.1
MAARVGSTTALSAAALPPCGRLPTQWASVKSWGGPQWPSPDAVWPKRRKPGHVARQSKGSCGWCPLAPG